MRAASLVGVLVLARVFGLAGRDLPWSMWLPSALLWHDVAVGVVFWLCYRLLVVVTTDGFGRPKSPLKSKNFCGNYLRMLSLPDKS
jgi:hypothetical protein